MPRGTSIFCGGYAWVSIHAPPIWLGGEVEKYPPSAKKMFPESDTKLNLAVRLQLSSSGEWGVPFIVFTIQVHSDGEVPRGITPSLPLLPGPLLSRIVVTVRVLSMGQIICLGEEYSVWFYGISTIFGYLMPNHVFTYTLNIYAFKHIL